MSDENISMLRLYYNKTVSGPLDSQCYLLNSHIASGGKDIPLSIYKLTSLFFMFLRDRMAEMPWYIDRLP